MAQKDIKVSWWLSESNVQPIHYFEDWQTEEKEASIYPVFPIRRVPLATRTTDNSKTTNVLQLINRIRILPFCNS